MKNNCRLSNIKHSLSPLLFGLLVLCSSCGTSRMIKQEKLLYPKREFRGAWIQTVHQNDYRSLSAQAFRELMNERLDRLKDYGINAILFQVRPEADAFYISEYEPWSRFLTGTQGVAPDEPDFDPMAFLIDACHRRGMEFHAWLNPYRAGTTDFTDFADTHICNTHPEWFVKYNRLTLFDPGIPDCRRFIRQVVRDIVYRYDVDAIHIDDYFYPYPVAGEEFPDAESFERYGKPAGYTLSNRNDWRRDNVNRLIQELKQTITATKPWVRFGVSPFGIYRNKSSDKHGSDTRGLQNYDDLYADVLLWMKKGWVDYCAPQLYWEIGHKSADYTTLIRWWDNRKTHVPLYIGQSVKRTMEARQLTPKMLEERESKHVQGHVLWPANELLWNNGGVVDSLKCIWHRYPALIPPYTHMHAQAPNAVRNVRIERATDGIILRWDAPQHSGHPEQVFRYVVYRFAQNEKCDTGRASAILAVTSEPSYRIISDPTGRYTYVVTALDRFHNESKPSKKIKF